jgi:hypothetical protein
VDSPQEFVNVHALECEEYLLAGCAVIQFHGKQCFSANWTPRLHVTSSNCFDNEAFLSAVDARRLERQLSWPGLAAAIWAQSRILNEQRNDHPISPATIRKLAHGTSCQHALFLLRWLDVPPETFIAVPQPGTIGVPLPPADEGQRLRWNLGKLYGALNAARTARGATWQQVADRLHCTPHQLTGLRTAKFATGLNLAMGITQALHRPAADFVYAAQW